LTEQAYNVVKSERKPRRNIAYKDLGMCLPPPLYHFSLIIPATAVSRIDNLEFLADIVPKTKTYKQFKEEAAQREEAKKAAVTGSGPFGLQNGINGDAAPHPPQARTIDIMMAQQANDSDASNMNGVLHAPTSSPTQPMHPSPMADRTLQLHSHPDQTEDVDMGD
jgi:DNA-directed RNA polymerase I subunit RPA43